MDRTITIIDELQSALPRVSLRKGSFSANVITLTAGTGLAQGFTVIATVILARVFTPADFGVFALFIAIVSLLSAASMWRYEVAVVLPEKHEDAVTVQIVAALILLGMCGLSLLGVALFRPSIAVLLGERQIATWVWGIPISLFLAGLYHILTYWCTRMKQFRTVAMTGFCQAVGTAAIQLALAILGFSGPTALVTGWIVGQALGVTILAARTARDRRKFWDTPLTWSKLRAAFIRYKYFPIYNTPRLLAQTATKQFIIFILRFFVGLNVVGLFSMARRAVYAPVSLLGSSMGQVFHTKAAVELKSGGLEPFVLRILKLQVLVGTPSLVVFVFKAKPICRILLGSNWANVGAYAAILAFLAYISFVVSWMEKIFDVQGRQRVALVWELSRDIVVVAGLLTALLLTRMPLVSVGVYAGLDFLFSVIWLILTFRAAKFSTNNLWSVGGVGLSSGGVALALMAIVQTVLRPR